MRLLRSYCVLILFLTAAAFAQFTTVSGTVTDPNGLPYAGGTIVPTLISSGPPTLNGQAYAPPSQPSGLSTAGSFVMQLGDNTVLLPGGSTWSFHVCSGTGTVGPSFGKGSVCFDVTGVTISGSSQNIGATLSAAAVALTANFGGSGLPAGCSNGQIAQFNGTTWVCANGGTGTVTGTGTSLIIPRWNSSSGLTNSLMAQTTTSNANAINIVANTTTPFFINGTITSGAATSLCSTGSGTPPLPTGVSSACFGAQVISNAQATNATGLSTGLQVQNSSLENTLVGIVGLAQGSGTSNNELRGIEADSQTGSAGAITNRAIVAWAAALGTTTTNQGLYAFTLVPNLVTLTNNYGAYIDSPLFNGSNGTISHNYGLFIADQTTTAGGAGNTNADPHALVTAGTAPSSFGGALTVSGNLTTNMAGGPFCVHETSGVLSATGSDCGAGGAAITKNYEAAGNASNVSSPFFFSYNTLPDVGADRGAVWAAAIAAPINGVNAFTVDARPEIAANISVTSNALSGTTGGRLLLPPGTINIGVGQFMPANANGLDVIGEGSSGTTTVKACASGHNGCGADLTLNGAGAVTAVLGMGPTTPASGQDVVGSSFHHIQADVNGVAGVMGVAHMAGQEKTEWDHIGIKNSPLVQFDFGEGTNSVQNGGDLHDFYFLENPSQAVYNPCPTAVTKTISTISNTTGGVVTVTLPSAPTPPLVQFGEVLITGQSNGATHGTVYNGLQEITSVISSTSFTYLVASGGLADSATGNGTVQAGPIGIRYFTSPNGGGRPIWNGTIVAAGCNATGTNPLSQFNISGGPLWAGHIHVEDATYGAAIGVDGNTKDITLDHFSPVTNVTNGVLISNEWTTTNVDINHLITTQGGGTPNTTSLIDQINGNTLTPTNNGHLPHYWIDSATGVFTTANPVSGTEVATGVDIYNNTISIFNAGTVGFSVNKTGTTTIAGQITATEPTGSVWGSATGGAKGAGTINAQNLFVNGVAVGTGSPLSGMTAGGVPIAATATTVTSSTTPGTNQGTYVIAHTNTTNGTAATLTEIQQGDCSGGGSTVSGTATYTVLYSDIVCTITHDIADTTAVTVTIPTPTTLHNANPIFVWENHSNQTDVLTPTTFTISLGHTAAASTLNVPSNVACRVSLDPKNASTWKADCHPIATSAGTVTSIATTSPITGGTITTSGTIACATCVTSASSLSSNALMTGAGGQASQTVTTGTGVVTALGVNTGTAGAFVVNGGGLGTPSSGTLTNATGLPINGVVSATGVIATIADGNNPLVINCALTSGTTCLTTGETTAASTAGAVEHQITTLTTTTAIPLQITQGAAGPANAAAPDIFKVSAAAAGGASGASNAGSAGAAIELLTGAGSAGGATTGNGGAGGVLSATLGAGGNAGGTATNNGGNGAAFNVTTGAGGNGGSGAGTAGSGGAITFTLGAPGTNSSTGTAGAVGQFNITGNAPASTANATGVNAGTIFNVSGVTGGASSNAAGTAGTGSVDTITSGAGGAGTGTNAVGGAGGNINITAGNGGASSGTGINSNGGNIIATPGAAGSGGSGTAGKAGVFQVAGPNAGFFGFQQGTANTTTNTQIPANTIVYQAPTAVTSYTVTMPGTAATGVPMNVNAANAVTLNYSGDSAHSVSQTSKTAAVTTFTVCAATAGTACGQVGQYRLTYNLWGSGTACSSVTAGSVVLNFTWTDENAVAHTTINVPMWDQKTSAMTAGQMNFNTALGTEGAGGSYIISTNGTIIQAATTYTGCTTGTGTYNLRISVEQLQ